MFPTTDGGTSLHAGPGSLRLEGDQGCTAAGRCDMATLFA
jgi:hypothetical protein